MSDDQKLYSTKQAAQFLGVSVITLKRWKKSGKLVPKEIGITSGKRGRKLVSKYTENQLKLVSSRDEISINAETSVIERMTNAEERVTSTRLPVPQPLVTRLLKGGTTTEVSTENEENASSIEVEVEEYYFDDDDDITIVNDSFKANLPEEYRQNLTKLFNKLTVAPFGEIFFYLI